MTTTTSRPIEWSRLVRNQIALLWRSRAALIVIGLALALFAVVEVGAVQQEASRLRLIELGRTTNTPYIPGIWDVHGLAGMILPLLWVALVWRGEAFDQRRYHWAMPVDQRGHDLARVVAGGVWLMVAMAALVLTALGVYAVMGRTVAFEIGLAYWISLFTVPLLTYTCVSILPIATSRPIGWGVGLWVLAVGVVLGLDAVVPVEAYPDLADTLSLQFAGWGPDPAWVGAHRVEYPRWSQAVTDQVWRFDWGGNLRWWLQATFLWMGLAVSGVFLAVRRRP